MPLVFLTACLVAETVTTPMGQLHVTEIPASALPTAVIALAERGVAVDRETEAQRAPDEVVYRCRRARVDVTFVAYPDTRKPDGLVIVMAYSQYSLRPWRWLDEWRLWNDVVDVFDRAILSA